MADFDYPEFLAARLDEWEVKASGILEEAPDWIAWWPRTVIADIAAKRSILDDYRAAKVVSQMPTLHPEGLRSATHERDVLAKVIQRLCRPFAEHPDYPREND